MEVYLAEVVSVWCLSSVSCQSRARGRDLFGVASAVSPSAADMPSLQHLPTFLPCEILGKEPASWFLCS